MPKSRKRPKAVQKARREKAAVQAIRGGPVIPAQGPARGSARSVPFQVPAGAKTGDPLVQHVLKVVAADGSAVVEAEGIPASVAEMLEDWLTVATHRDVAAAVTAEPTLSAAVARVLAEHLEHEAGLIDRMHEKIAAWENAGLTVVSSDLGPGMWAWQVTEWRTGRVLAEGSGNRAYDQAFDEHASWRAVDGLYQAYFETLWEEGMTLPSVPGVCFDLAESLAEWVGTTTTADPDVAFLLGVSPQEAAALRARTELTPPQTAIGVA